MLLSAATSNTTILMNFQPENTSVLHGLTNTNASIRQLLGLSRDSFHHYTTPIYLKMPSEVPEDHITFMFGILFLISIAVLCTMFILKLTKPKRSQFPLNHIRYGGTTSLLDSYDLIPRRSSLLLFLRSVTCGRVNASNRASGSSIRNSLSIVSSSSLNALPNYRNAVHSTSSTTLSTCSSSAVPPPAYEELENLTSCASISVRSAAGCSERLGLPTPRIVDRNNNCGGR
uniref:Uncharacterized protein n=1 Tax=Ditylenchus dipsaci TaxID=166011 RepID=A0A915CRN0_9BILA